MSHPNEQMLRTNYEAFAAGDLGPLLASLDDGIEWRVSGPSPLAGTYSSEQEILGFFSQMMELYGGTPQLEVIDVLADELHGVVLTRERGEHNGRTAEYEGVHRWDLRDGKCVRFENYYDDAYHEFWRPSPCRAV